MILSTYMHTRTHTCTHARMYTHAHIHTHTHACTHARMYTHVHTHTHTHSSILTIHNLIYSELKQIINSNLRRRKIAAKQGNKAGLLFWTKILTSCQPHGVTSGKHNYARQPIKPNKAMNKQQCKKEGEAPYH